MSEDDVSRTAQDGAAEVDDNAVDDNAVDDERARADGPPPIAAPAARRRGARLILPISLVALLVVSAVAAAVTYFAFQRTDERVDEAASASVIQAASDGAVALLSYSPETLDQDFSTAKARLTGDFLNYYTQFTAEIVTPAARQKSVKTSASVVRSALSKIEPTTAEVLLFINQSTISKENPDGSFTASSVKVEMTKVGDDWLISSFDPV